MGQPQWNMQPPMAGVEAPPPLGGEPQFETPGMEQPPSAPTTSFAPPGGFAPAQPSFAPPAQTAPAGGHELEIISAKLDTIKAQLENINTRLSNLERIAAGEQAPKGW
jgi:hypothetical protein